MSYAKYFYPQPKDGLPLAVADPGFPMGASTSWGALTPEAVTFQKFCMSK